MRPRIPAHNRTRSESGRGVRRLRSVARLLLACTGVVASVAALSTPAPAATKKPAAKASAAPVITPLNPCPKARTRVVAMKDTRPRAAIKVWENPDDTVDPKWTLGVGIESTGAVVFTVIGEQAGWFQVNVPIRPNGSIGWVRAADLIKPYEHGFYIVIELSKRTMYVCSSGRIIMQEKVAIGAANKGLTPTGTFFTLDLVRPKGGARGAYGPYAFGLSGYSETLERWGGGDGRLAIHGTNQPGLLGTAASHGCIRVSNAAITKMAKTLWLGVPVKITA